MPHHNQIKSETWHYFFLMENTSTEMKRQKLMGSNAEEDLTVVEKARLKVEEESGTI